MPRSYTVKASVTLTATAPQVAITAQLPQGPPIDYRQWRLKRITCNDADAAPPANQMVGLTLTRQTGATLTPGSGLTVEPDDRGDAAAGVNWYSGGSLAGGSINWSALLGFFVLQGLDTAIPGQPLFQGTDCLEIATAFNLVSSVSLNITLEYEEQGAATA